MKFITSIIALFLFSTMVVAQQGEKPPFTDYCEYLERDINGEQYGFLAGNKVYYVAGAGGADYRDITELETIGFTHPMFRDGRARGFGIVDAKEANAEGGVGHDCWGWEFWRHTKVAYGTLIIDGKRYERPEPKALYWRPDKLMVEYEVGGVNVKEEKYISTNDVLSTVITADKALQIEFNGESFYNPWKVPTFDGDAPNQQMTISSEAEITFNQSKNAIVLLENGKTFTKAQWGENAVEGAMMYSGLNIVFSSNKEIHSFERKELSTGNVGYKFSIDVGINEQAVLSYAVNEEANEALGRIKGEHKNIKKSVLAKTEFMNKVLNEQIPYFRSSDEMFNKTYYFLWSLYFMYFTDLKEGYEQYTHTQTAINNFMGLHLWDSWAYCGAGSYVANKDVWGFGNALSWQFMVPFKNDNNGLPDNFGTTWYSPKVRMNFEGAVEQIWEMYKQSGDKEFLNEVYYKLVRPLYIDNDQKGLRVNSAQAIVYMAEELNEKEDAKIFQAFVDRQSEWFPKHRWTHLMEQYEGRKPIVWKDIWDLADLRNNALSPELAAPFIDQFVMNTEKGFISPLGLNTRAADSPPNGIFRASSISCWLGVDGLFRQEATHAGIVTTLNHFNAMTREYGYPIAPEAWDHKFEGWGSRYYNWDIAMVLPVIEWLGGVDYSILDDSFTFSPHMPDSWDFIEMYVPVVTDGKTNWVHTKVERVEKDAKYELVHTVEGNPLATTYIKPYDEGREVVKRQSKIKEKNTKEGVVYVTKDETAKVSWLVADKLKAEKTLVWMHPKVTAFSSSTAVSAENIIPGTTIRYTTDGSIPTLKSPLFNEPIKVDKTTTFTIKAFGNDINYTPYKVTYELANLHPSTLLKEEVVSGLNYKLYALPKDVRELPDFSVLEPTDKGVITMDNFIPQLKFEALELKRKEHFALHISGYINVDKDEIYNFNLRSDDGSMLFIDDQEVIRLNSRSHVDPWSFDGNIGLIKGMHKIDIYYTQYTKKSHLALTYKFLSEFDFRAFPPASFKRKKGNDL